MRLDQARRVVIKVGSLLMTDSIHHVVHGAWLATLAQDIAQLRAQGIEVVVVSSGAVALGRGVLGLGNQVLTLEEKQAAAACGQIKLVQAWQEALAVHRTPVAQLLITAQDTESRRRYLNARTTLDMLLTHGVVPIINENDTITTEEIRYGDNDRLAARVAAMASADVLVLLSDIDGLYDADPKTHPQATLIPVIDAITSDIEAMAGGSREQLASGGMKTKIMAARIATAAGCHLVIARGTQPHPLMALLEGGDCSWFVASQSPLNARKHWIAGAVQLRGSVVVDAGAARAIVAGSSLLPVGAVAVEGTFERGDTIAIVDQGGSMIAKGIASYSADEARRIVGKQSDAIEAVLGYKRRDALVHLDDMVVQS